MEVFNFDPSLYTEEYNKNGYVHIKGGVNPAFLNLAHEFMRQSIANESEASLEEWRFKGKKAQFLFDFPESTDFDSHVRKVVGSVAGMKEVTLCERHIKVYEEGAPSTPPPHKDRVASQLTVGIPLSVPEDSLLILYPDIYRDVNPFYTTALYRSSLDEELLPEKILNDYEPLKIDVRPGDVIMFRGAAIYHERLNPSNTSLLYLKFNDMNLDPLGEDPKTDLKRKATLDKLTALGDQELLNANVEVAPQVEKISRHYTRLFWKEVIQVYITGAKEITIDEDQLRFLKIATESIELKVALRQLGLDTSQYSVFMPKVRKLIKLGALNII